MLEIAPLVIGLVANLRGRKKAWNVGTFICLHLSRDHLSLSQWRPTHNDNQLNIHKDFHAHSDTVDININFLFIVLRLQTVWYKSTFIKSINLVYATWSPRINQSIAKQLWAFNALKSEILFQTIFVSTKFYSQKLSNEFKCENFCAK